jgi:hypothetical protein
MMMERSNGWYQIASADLIEAGGVGGVARWVGRYPYSLRARDPPPAP